MSVARSLPVGHPLSAAVTVVSQAGSRAPRIPEIGLPDGSLPPGEGWVAVSDLVPGDYLATWLAETKQREAFGHRQAAAMKLTEWLAQAVLGFAVQSVFLAGTAPDVSTDNIWLRWQSGTITGVTLARADAAVLAARAVGEHAGVITVPDDAALDEWLAHRVAMTLSPLLSAIRARTGTGLVTLWGRVADVVHVWMLRAAKDLGYDTHAAWERAQRLTDAIGAAVPRLRLRPRPFPVHGVDQDGCDWDGTWLVFGTCCFLYKARPDIRQCNVCPLRSDAGRSFDWPHELPPAAPAESTTACAPPAPLRCAPEEN